MFVRYDDGGPITVTADCRLPTACVLGLGNVLMSDDGWGPVVVGGFEAEYAVGTSVEVADLGTPGLDLSPWLADVQRVILVDTVRADAPPGTIRVYQKDDVLGHPPGARTGPHEPGVKEALHTLEFAGRGPRELVLIGVVPACIAPGLALSREVKNAIAPAVSLIVAQLRIWRQPVFERIPAGERHGLQTEWQPHTGR